MGTVTESPCSMKVILSISTLVAAAIAQVPLGFAPHAVHPAHHAVAAPVPVAHHAVHHAVAPVVHAAPALHHAVHAAPAVHAVHAVHAAPAVHAVHAVHDVIPHDYTYGYDVNELDAYGNPNIHSKTETREGGIVKGQYRVNLPDCRTQIVDYVVDEYQQYHADVKYEGVICEDPTAYHGAPVVAHAVHAAPIAHAVHAAPLHHAVPVAAVGHHSAHHADALGHHAVHGVQVAPVAHHAVHAAPVAVAHHAVHAAPLAHHALGPLVHQG